MIAPIFLLEEALHIENLLVLAAIVIALDIIVPTEVPMNIPTTKAEARAFLQKSLDDLDGVPDSLFDPKAFAKRMAGAFADDWQENLIIAGLAIVIWELAQVAYRVFA